MDSLGLLEYIWSFDDCYLKVLSNEGPSCLKNSHIFGFCSLYIELDLWLRGHLQAWLACLNYHTWNSRYYILNINDSHCFNWSFCSFLFALSQMGWFLVYQNMQFSQGKEVVNYITAFPNYFPLI